jgi:hypothetical protein
MRRRTELMFQVTTEKGKSFDPKVMNVFTTPPPPRQAARRH